MPVKPWLSGFHNSFWNCQIQPGSSYTRFFSKGPKLKIFAIYKSILISSVHLPLVVIQKFYKTDTQIQSPEEQHLGEVRQRMLN